MRLIDRLYDHSVRVRRHLGDRVTVGPRKYKVAGYLSNIVSIDDTGEKEVRRVIGRLLQKPGVFIDVGANLGQTLGRVLSVDQDRRYLGFEPQVSACFYVSRFLQDNSIKTAQVLPFGLGCSNGLRRFWSLGDADTMGSLVDHHAGSRETLVPVRCGDEVLAELGISGIVAIKIDVEGAELEVMQGLTETLRREHPPVLFEVLPNYTGHERSRLPADVTERQSANAAKIWQLLTGLGYRIFQLDPDGNEIAIDGFDLDRPERFIGLNYVARVD